MLANINTPEDVANHKNYKLEYEHWLADLKDPLIKQNISTNFQKAQVFEEAFTQEEISWMYGYAFSQCGTVRHNDNGTMFTGSIRKVCRSY